MTIVSFINSYDHSKIPVRYLDNWMLESSLQDGASFSGSQGRKLYWEEQLGDAVNALLNTTRPTDGTDCTDVTLRNILQTRCEGDSFFNEAENGSAGK